VSPGLVAAFGLHPGVGLDIALKYSHSSLDSQRLIQPGNRGTFGPGAFFSFDLAQLISIPVGVGLSYSASIPLDGGSVWHYFNTGIYYIGNHDLVLGADVVVRTINFDPGVSITSKGLDIIMRYTWR